MPCFANELYEWLITKYIVKVIYFGKLFVIGQMISISSSIVLSILNDRNSIE